jgi:hypothetical protein
MSTEEGQQQQSMPNTKRRTTPRRSSSSDGVMTMAALSRRAGGADRGGPRDASTEAFAATKSMILSLRSEMNGMEVKHKEELYWLKLELDTTRREKEAVEDRIESLYREMQEIDAAAPAQSAKSGGKLPPGRAGETNAQLQKYEKMMRVMNNQIGLLRNSSDKLLKTLKDEISSVIDEKGRAELILMNQISDLEKENRELKVRVQIAEQGQQPPPSNKPKDVHRIAPARLASASGDAASNPSDIKKLKDEIRELKQQNQKKNDELAQSQDSLIKLGDECEALTKVVNELKREVQVVRSSEATQSALDRIRTQQEESKALLERVAEIWDQADETVQGLSPLMEKLAPARSNDPQASGTSSDDPDRMLSVLETASLVHGQAKVSLMLVELKLRNSLGCIWNDRSHLQPFGSGGDEYAAAFEARLNAAQAEAMAAIEQVRGAVQAQFAHLEAQSEEVTATLTESIESRIGELQRMQSRQSELQQMLTNLRESEQAETREVVNADGSVDMFVSRKVLERLQSEVLLIVDRVREKNEEIARLTATVDELKVRERAFMDELRRMMQEQSRIEMEERNRRMLAQAQQDLENDEDDVTDSDYDDCSSSAYEQSGDDDDDEDDVVEEEEESFLEETVAD